MAKETEKKGEKKAPVVVDVDNIRENLGKGVLVTTESLLELPVFLVTYSYVDDAFCVALCGRFLKPSQCLLIHASRAFLGLSK